MHIGINASFLRKPGTGIGQVTQHFLKELVTHVESEHSLKNHKFFIYCEEMPEFVLPKNFVVRRFLPWYKRDDLFRRLLWEKFYLPRYARRDRCDVLISLYQSATIIKYTDMRHIMMVHDVIPHIFPEYLDNLRKKIYWEQVEKGIYASQHIIAVSEHTKLDLVTRLNVRSQRVSVIPIAADPIFSHNISINEIDRVMKKYGITDGEYIYSGGGLELRKDVDRTLRAYKMLCEHREDAPPLVISGKLMPELAPLIIDVEQIVYDLGLVDRVKIIGFVPQQDLPALYKGACFFVFPSLYEGFGLPILEAMNMGTPVLTAHDSSLGEVGADAVLYVEHDDTDLCSKMEMLLDDAALRRDLSAKGVERSKDFQWQKFIDTMCKIINA
jgi:glycosyltransferase involved in cell wall biosynthesis